jgi:hypothetical protein
LVLATELGALQLLACLRQVEFSAGRQRAVRWGARTLDLDLLLYEQLVLRTPELEIPHPRMCVRRFVLDPALEIAADWVHPTTGWTVRQLAEHLRRSPRYVALAGAPGSGKSRLARAVAQHLDAQYIADLPQQPPSVHSPSPVFERQLEWTRCRADLLGAISGRSPARWLVTDFWLPQAMAYASILFPPAELQQFRERWQPMIERALPPRFTAAVHLPVDRAWAALRRENVALSEFDERRLRRLVAAIDEQSHRPGQGPVLHFDCPQNTANLDQIVAEIVAAAHASQ